MRKLVIPKYYGRPSIGLALFGCTNRPFYHICVFPDRALGRRYESNILEQVGTFDPLPNTNNEKLVAFNFGRLKYWIGERNAHISVPVLELLGLSGLFPIHPKTFIRARDNQQAASTTQQEPSEEEAELQAKANNSTMKFPLQSTLFVVIFLPLVRSTDSCYSNVDIRGKLSNSTPAFKILNSSGECIRQQNNLEREFQIEPKTCASGLLSIDLSPLASIQSANTLPHVELNISVMAHAEVTSIFVRLHCLHAPDSEDVYCHDASKMVFDGSWRWPCRGLTVGPSQADLPLIFGYTCFRLYSLSQYYINVTVYPQNCRETFLLTSPAETQLFPSIAKFYDPKNHANFKWSPVLFVDLTETDGVWFRVSYPRELQVRSIVLTVFDTSGNGVKKVDSYEVVHPTTGVKWQNAAQGQYSVYAFIQRHDCSLLCDSGDSGCVTCAHTHLNFTLPEDAASFSWKGLRTIRDSGLGVVFMVLAICLILVVGVSSILYARRHLIRPAVTELELQDIKKIHVVYSDDCEEHSHAVMELVRFLEASNSVRVTIDQRDLMSHGARPAVWLVDSIKRADAVLIVVSPLTGFLLEGKKLTPRRPYPDTFGISCDIIFNEWSTDVSSRRKFSLVTLPYSPAVPRHLAILNLHTFKVPQDVGELLLSIQNNSDTERSRLCVENSASLLVPFNLAIENMTQMLEKNPDWVKSRFNEEKDGRDSINLSLQNKKVGRNDDEETLLCGEMDLLPPDEVVESEAATVFDLLARDDSSSDSD